MRVSGLNGTSRPIRVSVRRKTPRASLPTRSAIFLRERPWRSRLSTSTSMTLPGIAFRISSASISVPITGFAATMAAVRPGNDDVVAGFEHRVEMRLDVGSLAHDPLDDGAAADFVLDCLDRSPGRRRDPVGARLEFAIV